MLPLKLTLNGFAAYKDATEPLDFTDLDRFAIVGPTGSGKTSLIEAMVFALYGNIPRFRTTNCRELVCLGKDRATVTLEFKVGDKGYRITRVQFRKNRGGQAKLETLEGKPIAGQVRKVDDEIKRMLGLDYVAFTQSVVLPQGQFAQFLKSAKKDRREILRELLRLGHYEAMRKAAAINQKDKKVKMEAIEERLADDYSGITQATLDEHCQELKVLEAELTKLRENEIADKEAFSVLQGLHKATAALAKQGEILEQLNSTQQEVDTWKKLLQADAEAEKLQPKVERVQRALQIVQDDQQGCTQAEEAVANAKAGLEAALSSLKAAQSEAKELPALRKQKDRLTKAITLLGPRNEAQAALQSSQKSLGDTQQALENLQARVHENKALRKRQQEQLKEQKDRRKAHPYRQGLHDQFEEAREEFQSLAHLREQHTEQATKKEALAKSIPGIEDELKETQGREELAQSHYHASMQSLEDARQAGEESRAKLERLRNRKGELKELLRLDQAKQRLDTELIDVTTKLDGLKADLLAQNTAFTENNKARKSVEKECRKLEGKRSKLGYQPEAHQKLEEAVDDFEMLEDFEEKLGGLETLVEGHRQDVDQRRESLQESLADEETAQEHHSEAEAALVQARAMRRQGQQEHAAAQLREHLHTGGDCPVCLQAVETVPPTTATAALGELDHKVEQAEQLEQATRAQRVKSGEVVAKAQTLVEEAESHLKRELEAQCSTKAERAEFLAQLEKSLAKQLKGWKGKTLSERYHKALGELAGKKEQVQTLDVQIEEHQALFKALGHEADLITERQASIAQNQATVDEQARALKLRLKEVVKECKALAPSDSPTEELEQIEQQAESLEEKATEQITIAEAALEKAKLTLDQVSKEVAEAKNILKHDKAQLANLEKEATALSTQLEQAQKQLLKRFKKELKPHSADFPEEQFQLALENSRTLREEAQELDEVIETLENDQRESTNEQELLNTQLTSTKKEKKSLEARVQKNQKTLDSLLEQIREVTTSDDPAAEKEQVAARCQQIEQAQEVAQESHKEAEKAVALAEKEQKGRKDVLQRSEKEHQDAQKALTEALESSSFATLGEVEDTRLESTRKVELEEQLKEHETNLDRAQVRIKELSQELGEQRVDDETLGEAQEGLKALRQQTDEIHTKLGDARRAREELEKRLEKSAHLQAELQAAMDEHAIDAQLAKDLRSENFQSFLLEESFRDLVRGASIRLMKLSREDYELAVVDDEFYVIDHNNGSQERSADTLSGGETFLASLALALELSAQVQKAAGAVNLDSLFIDEGFGTLDPETLDVVAQAIETLHDSGRMVGIITHIKELSQRLPARIVVSKDSQGSRFRLDREMD